MLYHDMTNDYKDRDYKITITLQEGYYEYLWGGAMGHGIPFDTVTRVYNDLIDLEYDEDDDWEHGYPSDKTGGFEYHNNCGFVIDKDDYHVHFILHDQEGNKLEKTISKHDLKLYIVGIAITSCVGHGVKRDSRKCAQCKNFDRVEGTASGVCSVKNRKVSQGTTICKYGFIALT
ncbi:MAG: hypothetical protein SNI70_03655 [Rikenellaceae bacterium]